MVNPGPYWETVNAGIVHSKWGFHIAIELLGPFGRIGITQVLDEKSFTRGHIYKELLDYMVATVDMKLQAEVALLTEEPV